MEVLNWLSKEYGYGYGDGDGSGCGSENGYGDGYGYGSGYGYLSGGGDGHGNGGGDGDGSGCGWPNKLNNKNIYSIDSTATIITTIKGNLAKGFIVNKDLSLTKTYVVKDSDSQYFAHGSTIKDAIQALQDKIIANMDVEEVIEMFLSKTEPNKDYPVSYFFDWHGKLTGSCLQGRQSFIKNNNIDLDKDVISLRKFIELTINEYGEEVIKQIKEKL
jgi:hypothetical protein